VGAEEPLASLDDLGAKAKVRLNHCIVESLHLASRDRNRQLQKSSWTRLC
jgi:hypothetical protein